ncbi:SymE family type I addiction module toxin [Caldimonas brevitalea]|uniref:SymE family type I addiction module toxin n=1 Tax=Caldimonas brevitalea TaxID=413882 RepID=UPI0014702297
MADVNHRPGEASPSRKLLKHERYISVCATYQTYQRAGNGLHTETVETRVPWMRLSGKWLEAAGFAIRARVRIRITDGCLVLTTD